MGAATSVFTSEEEFLSLPESLDKVELIDGEVFVAPAPSPLHQSLVGELFYLLKAWARLRTPKIFIGQSPLDIRFSDNRILQPDVFVVFKDLAQMTEGPITDVPPLCVEILSSNRAYDRVTKRFIYAAAGVQEYWVVDPAGRIERFSGEGLETHEEITAGTLASPLLPGFSLDVDAFFAR